MISFTGAPARVLAYVGYVWLVLALYVAMVLVVLELPRRLVARHDPGRRRTLARLFGGGAAVLAVGTVGYGVSAARPPRLVRREVTLERLDPGLDGVTIAVLADIHLGPINGRPSWSTWWRR